MLEEQSLNIALFKAALSASSSRQPDSSYASASNAADADTAVPASQPPGPDISSPPSYAASMRQEPPSYRLLVNPVNTNTLHYTVSSRGPLHSPSQLEALHNSERRPLLPTGSDVRITYNTINVNNPSRVHILRRSSSSSSILPAPVVMIRQRLFEDEEEGTPFVLKLMGLVMVACLGWVIVQVVVLPGCSEGFCQ